MNSNVPDGRYSVNMPSGLVKNPKMHIAGVDLYNGNVVWLDGDAVRPMCDESQKMYGVVLADGLRGKRVLVAT